MRVVEQSQLSMKAASEPPVKMEQVGQIVTVTTSDHNKLINRDLPKQHPISSIDGLEKALVNKLDNSELPNAIDDALAEAKESGMFDGKDGTNGKPGKDGKDGYTPIKGVDYFDGKDGVPGKDGQPGLDGFSPVVAVQDITGGHRVTITDKDGDKAFDVMDGKDGEGGGGGSPAIIDVVELPETGIDKDNFYRRLSGQFYYNGILQGDWTCYIVETLPPMGVPVTTDMVHVSLYYAIDTGAVSGYIPDALAGAVGVPAGWYPVEVLGQEFGLAWGGIISDASQDPIDGASRLLLKYDVYHHAQGWVNLSDKVGWRGESGGGAEVFNTLQNKATGGCSHAEGFHTFAHGVGSHAEGNLSTASGYASHAEGVDTIASGYASHAEGLLTAAIGRSQHVEGEYNIRDFSYNEETRGKFIHIAGNGTGEDSLSNAYTLDWDGNGWFAGTVECTGILLTSPNGTKYKITVADDGTLSAATV